MRVNGYPFISYNDFHIAFHKMDVIEMEAMRALPDVVKGRFSFGEGIDDVLRDDTVESIINHTESTGDADAAQFHIQSFVMAEEGTKISGDDLADLFAEAKAKNVTIASLLHKLPHVNTRIVVSPGPGVVEQAVRTGRKKGGQDSEELPDISGQADEA